jgi:inosine-uridine nucleoside N-ribohydrolase
MVRAAPQRLTLLTLGPLTNLALALQLDPGMASLVARVIVMGGAFGWGPVRGNVSPVAEANIRNDPHAADEVLAAPWPVVMVGLDVTARCIFTNADARRLADQGGDTGRFLWDISRGYEAMYRRLDGIDGCCLHDVAAAVCVVEPSLFATNSGPTRVVTEGIAIGQTIQRLPGRSFPTTAWDDIPAQRACHDVDVAGVVRTYSDTLISRGAVLVDRT